MIGVEMAGAIFCCMEIMLILYYLLHASYLNEILKCQIKFEITKYVAFNFDSIQLD
jgi:hypothetical protein